MMEILIKAVRGLEPNLICHALKLYRKNSRMTFGNMRELLHHSDEPISMCICAGLDRWTFLSKVLFSLT